MPVPAKLDAQGVRCR